VHHRALFLLLLVGGFGGACTSAAEDSAATARDTGSQSPRDEFHLSRIGSSELLSREQSLRTCNLRPFHGWYALNSGRWESGDSVFVNCDGSPIDSTPVFQTESGTYRLHGDTIDFFVPDTNVGVRGLVNRGLLRQNTLLIWGSDMDGGDYTFIRVPK